MPKKIPSNIKIFNLYFVQDINNLYLNKAYKKCHLIIYSYNDGKKIHVLMYLSKLLGVSQSIDFHFATII